MICSSDPHLRQKEKNSEGLCYLSRTYITKMVVHVKKRNGIYEFGAMMGEGIWQKVVPKIMLLGF